MKLKLTLKLRTKQDAQERIILSPIWENRKTAQYFREKKAGVRDIIRSNRKLLMMGCTYSNNVREPVNITTHGSPEIIGKIEFGNIKWSRKLDKFRKYWLSKEQYRKVLQILGKIYILKNKR